MERCDHLDGRRLKEATLVALALFFLLTTIIGAFALSVEAPRRVNEGEPVTVSIAGSGQLSILRDGIIVSSGTGKVVDTLQTNSTSAGLVNYILTNGTHNETRSVEVRDVPLSLNIIAPGTDVTVRDVTFSLTTNWQPELCYVNIDGASHTLQGDGASGFSGTFPLADGAHTVDYKCKLGSEMGIASKTLYVDATPPVVSAIAPAGDVLGAYATLIVDTTEIAQCRYGTQDAGFDELPALMGQTYATRNTAAVTIENSGSYTYFVRCQDVHGNKMASPAIISFAGKLPPSASIDVDGNEPLKAGTYSVTLTSSQALKDAPKLTYTFQESAAAHQVALTGEGTAWEGFITIPAGLTDTVVSFAFEGTSRDGVKGTTITSDSLFTVDAVPPKALDAIAIDNASSSLKLKWFTTTASDVAAYNIYRADHEGVTYTDFHTSTMLTEYVDRSATGARYLHYRVAPVDFAGNIGPLSAEVYGSAVDKLLAEADVAVADPVLQARLDEEIASMTAALLDANATIAQLESERNAVNIQIIKDMGLVSRGRQGAAKIETAISLLRELRARNPGADEVDNGIAKSRQLLGEARGMLISRIIPEGQAQTKQAADPAGLERAMPYALIGQNLTADQRAAYLADATALQDKVTVSLDALSFRLFDLAGVEHQYTLIKKQVSLQEPRNDITLIESIPKQVSASASAITFSAQPVVLEDDPVVSYTLPILELHEYSYTVERMVSLDEVKNTRTFLYPALPVTEAPAEKPKGDMLTGNATRLTLPGMPSTDKLLIVIGILVVIGLGAYYVSLSADKPFKGLPPSPAQRATQTPAQRPRPAPRFIINGPIVRVPLNTPSMPPVAPKPPTSEGIKAMLADAKSAIDRKEYDASLALYKDVLNHLQTDEDLSRILQDQTLEVYAKLMLFRHLTDANRALQRKDTAALRDALAQVRQAAAQIGEEDTQLIREAKDSYAAFTRSLNTLEIERVGRY